MLFLCKDRQLPAHHLEAAAAEAVRVNPANRVNETAAASLSLGKSEIAALTNKLWGPKGRKFGVTFMQPITQARKSLILDHANEWAKYGNVSFAESASGEVRVDFQKDGFWSFIGSDILQIPRNEATMNLEGFDGDVPESEYKRVVEHEFAHTLGFIHEHQRAAIVARIDPQQAYAYFWTWDRWDKATVDAQVLTPLNEATLTATPADVRSILCYDLPAEIMRDGIAVPGGMAINEQDGSLCARCYPKAVGPVVPPPGTKAGIQLDADMVKGNYVAVLSSLTWPARVIHIAVDGLIPAGKHEVK